MHFPWPQSKVFSSQFEVQSAGKPRSSVHTGAVSLFTQVLEWQHAFGMQSLSVSQSKVISSGQYTYTNAPTTIATIIAVVASIFIKN